MSLSLHRAHSQQTCGLTVEFLTSKQPKESIRFEINGIPTTELPK